MYLLLKYLVTAGLVVLISEVARRNDRLGGLLAALPLVTVLTLCWLRLEQQSADKIGNHAWYTFWYLLPTLPMFLSFPWLQARCGFVLALLLSVLGTVLLFWGYARLLQRVGIHLL